MKSSGNREWRAGAFALALLVVGAVIALVARAPDDDRVVEQLAVTTVLPKPRPLPAFALTDHDGQPYDATRLNNNWDLVFFGFSNCAAICPTTLLILSTVAQATEPPARVVFISVDPRRDTTERLRTYVQAFGDRVTGVSGADTQLVKIASALGATYSVPDTDGDYMVEHSGAVFLVDPRGRYAGVITRPDDPESMVADLQHLIGT